LALIDALVKAVYSPDRNSYFHKFREVQTMTSDYELLRDNSYSEDGVFIGKDWAENMVQACWITRTDPEEQNRIFRADANGRVYIEVSGISNTEDSTLVPYDAMGEALSCSNKKTYVVGNGKHTNEILKKYPKLCISQIMRDYVPEGLNPSPLIAACFYWEQYEKRFVSNISIRWNDAEGQPRDKCIDDTTDDEWGQGYGYFRTTPCKGAVRAAINPLTRLWLGKSSTIANEFWAALHPENRVALAVKFISKNGSSRIITRSKYS